MKWIFDTHDCPCLMKIDMEKSRNVYDFLRVYYEEIDSEEDWKDLSFSNLKCGYCLLCSALELARADEEKYGKETITKLAVTKSIASKRLFKYNPLKWFYIWIKKRGKRSTFR